MTTRRNLLIGASCAAVAAASPFAVALGATNTRRNIIDVEKDPGALQALRDAIDVLRKKDDYGKRPAIDGWFDMMAPMIGVLPFQRGSPTPRSSSLSMLCG